MLSSIRMMVKSDEYTGDDDDGDDNVDNHNDDEW